MCCGHLQRTVPDLDLIIDPGRRDNGQGRVWCDAVYCVTISLESGMHLTRSPVGVGIGVGIREM